MSIRCKLGLHKWKIIRDRKMLKDYPNFVEVDAIRICTKCGRQQKEDYHCLGLNPPEHKSHWFNI